MRTSTTAARGKGRKMVSHPNRPNKAGERKAGSNPRPEDVRALRMSTGLSAAAIAALVHSTANSWLQWEREPDDPHARRMHPAFWELALIKTGRIRAEVTKQ